MKVENETNDERPAQRHEGSDECDELTSISLPKGPAFLPPEIEIPDALKAIADMQGSNSINAMQRDLPSSGSSVMAGGTMERMMHDLLQNHQSLQESLLQVMTDVNKMKAALPKSNLQETDAFFEPTRHTTMEGFLQFCETLAADESERDVFVSYLIASHGSVNIGEVVRACMRCIVKDDVLINFNRTGRDGKQELPPILQKCILRCVKQFQQKKQIQVKIGRNDLHSTVEGEFSRQLEIYISNAGTRLKRTAGRALSRSRQENVVEEN